MVATWAGPRVPTRVYTVGLHRPNPVAREMPGFIGFFARRDQVAEREGFSPLLAGLRRSEVLSYMRKKHR